VRKSLDDSGVEVRSSDVVQNPKARVALDEAAAGKLLKLIDALEENDDVDSVHANFDIDSEVLERLMAEA
jgi:transcriptional/translational regulatory protein YebC/TACO1